MINKETIDFLRDLKQNNDRDWFTKNKSRFQDAQNNLLAFTGELIQKITDFDETIAEAEPPKCVFRIYRDVRFSKDKSPYKTNLGAAISPQGRKALGSLYYFHIEPDTYFSAAGVYLPDAQALLKIRNAISDRSTEFNEIIADKKFLKRFGKIDGDRLQRPPKGFLADDKMIEFLKLKSFTVSQVFTEIEVLKSDYSSKLAESFKVALPLNNFLNKALTS